jgi:hypothetical protein
MLWLFFALVGLSCCELYAADNLSPPSSRQPEAAPPKATPGLGTRKAELRGYLQKRSGVRPEKPTIPRGKPFDYGFCLKQYESVQGDKKKLYALIAHHLRLAEALLEQEPDDIKRSAVGVLLAAARCAADRLKDDVLAADLCEVWLLPNLEHAASQRWKHPSRQMLLEEATVTFGRDKRFKRMAEVARLWIEGTSSLNVADSGRLQLARALDGQGQTADALQVLTEITNESLKPDRDLIPALRAKLKAQAESKSPQ